MTLNLRLEREEQLATFSPRSAVINLGLYLPHDVGTVVEDLIVIADENRLRFLNNKGEEITEQYLDNKIRELTFTGFQSNGALDGYLMGLASNSVELIRVIIRPKKDVDTVRKLKDLEFKTSIHKSYTLGEVKGDQDDPEEHYVKNILSGTNDNISPLYVSTTRGLHVFAEPELDRMNGLHLEFNNRITIDGRTPRLFTTGYDDIRSRVNGKPRPHQYVLLSGDHELKPLAVQYRIRGGKMRDPIRRTIVVPSNSTVVIPLFTEHGFAALDSFGDLWYLPRENGYNTMGDRTLKLTLGNYGLTGNKKLIPSTQKRDERPLVYIQNHTSIVRYRLLER